MPRTQTAAAERTAQNDKLQTQVAAELGVDHVTVRQAQAHQRERKTVTGIKARVIDLEDENLKPVGVVIARVNDYKIVRGVTASLAVVTDANEFGDVLHDAARISNSELLVMAMFVIPRDLGLEDEGDEEG